MQTREKEIPLDPPLQKGEDFEMIPKVPPFDKGGLGGILKLTSP
jgi:hypothetical protein